MELVSLARKQKRLKDWSEVVKFSSIKEELRLRIVDTLKLYRNLLAKCWEAGTIEESDSHKIEELERQLEELYQEAHLAGSAFKFPQTGLS